MEWQDKKFRALVDSGVIRNYILLVIVKRLKIPCKQKRNLHPLVTILGDLIAYREGIIYIKIELI